MKGRLAQTVAWQPDMECIVLTDQGGEKVVVDTGMVLELGLECKSKSVPTKSADLTALDLVTKCQARGWISVKRLTVQSSHWRAFGSGPPPCARNSVSYAGISEIQSNLRTSERARSAGYESRAVVSPNLGPNRQRQSSKSY